MRVLLAQVWSGGGAQPGVGAGGAGRGCDGGAATVGGAGGAADEAGAAGDGRGQRLGSAGINRPGEGT